MQFSKNKMYFVLHLAFIALVLLYQALWIFSKTTQGEILYYGNMDYYDDGYEHIGTMTVRYTANDKTYEEAYTRNATPNSQRTIRIRYLSMFPGYSRIDSYIGNWLTFEIIYVIFFLFTTMLFFNPNEIIPKGTIFVFTKKKPWLRMENA